MHIKKIFFFILCNFFTFFYLNAVLPGDCDTLPHLNIDQFVRTMTRAAHRPYLAADEYNTFRNLCNIVFNTREKIDPETAYPWRSSYTNALRLLDTDKASPEIIIDRLRGLFPKEASKSFPVETIPRIRPEKIKPRTIIPHIQDALRHTNVTDEYLLKRITWLIKTLETRYKDFSTHHPLLKEKLEKIEEITKQEAGAIDTLRTFLMPKWTPPTAHEQACANKRRGSTGYRNKKLNTSPHMKRR